MTRKTYKSPNARQQFQKSKVSRGNTFTMFRPVSDASADRIYELMKSLKADNTLPEETQLRESGTMRVTYLEKSKLSRELQGFAQGFNSREAIERINNGCEESREESIVAALGRVSLMDRRDETLVVRLDHNQIIADEFSLTTAALRSLHVHLRDQFKPHISLARIPNLGMTQKQTIARQLQDIIPDEVILDPLIVEPSLRK